MPSTGPRWSPPSSLAPTFPPLIRLPDALGRRLPTTGSHLHLFFSQLPDSTNPNSNPSTRCPRTRMVLPTDMPVKADALISHYPVSSFPATRSDTRPETWVFIMLTRVSINLNREGGQEAAMPATQHSTPIPPPPSPPLPPPRGLSPALCHSHPASVVCFLPPPSFIPQSWTAVAASVARSWTTLRGLP